VSEPNPITEDAVGAAVEEAVAAIAAAGDSTALKAVRTAHLGESSPLARLNGAMRQVAPEQKAAAGKLVGQARGRVNQAFADREAAIVAAEAQAALVAAYEAALPEGVAPRVLVSRAVYPDRDRASALAKLVDGARRWQSWLADLGRPGVADVSPEEYLVRDHTRFGSAEEIASSLAADPGVAAATELLVSFPPAVPELAEHRRLLEAVATDLAPRLGWEAAR